MMRRRQSKYSRLTQREKKKYTRQTIYFSVLTIFLLIAILFWGIPSLIKVAIFLSSLRSSSQPITGEDTIAPPPPILQPLVDATNSATIRVQGFAEEGTNLILSLNGTDAYETLVENDGEFLFKTVQLNLGENIITARSIDSSGNQSKASNPTNIIFDNSTPALIVTAPENGASFFGTQDKTIRVNGVADSDTTVRINDSLVILSQDGTFSHQITLAAGENTITIIARDRAGNESQETRTVTYEE